MIQKFARTLRGWAQVEDDTLVLLDGDPHEGLHTLRPRAERLPVAGTPLLAPVRPTKIVAIARNYRAHAAELGNAVPEDPLFFHKPLTTLTPPGGVVELPAGVGRVEHEGELALVIGKTARHVPREQALEYVLGYTCANDVTARELQKKLGHFSQAKGYDGFCPVGPYLVVGLDARDLRVSLSRNGSLVQEGRTSEMVHDVPALIAYLSQCLTLNVGDVVLTGTPKGVGPLSAGDEVEISIEGVGVLRHGVAAAT
jgi:2-keto-4-pentenoate hydratase/2-oxohepta-3-ene-1,7-dioic acid hydratase in catechol pathway